MPRQLVPFPKRPTDNRAYQVHSVAVDPPFSPSRTTLNLSPLSFFPHCCDEFRQKMDNKSVCVPTRSICFLSSLHSHAFPLPHRPSSSSFLPICLSFHAVPSFHTFQPAFLHGANAESQKGECLSLSLSLSLALLLSGSSDVPRTAAETVSFLLLDCTHFGIIILSSHEILYSIQ